MFNELESICRYECILVHNNGQRKGIQNTIMGYVTLGGGSPNGNCLGGHGEDPGARGQMLGLTR